MSFVSNKCLLDLSLFMNSSFCWNKVTQLQIFQRKNSSLKKVVCGTSVSMLKQDMTNCFPPQAIYLPIFEKEVVICKTRSGDPHVYDSKFLLETENPNCYY